MEITGCSPPRNGIEGKDVPNNISIRRLKDKLGTQSLPTAEIDFEGSKAYLIGNAEDGIHHLMNYVLNASRIHNATNALGLIHRAFLEARNYAEQRAAFQTEIINFPLIQEYLLNILTYVTAKRNLTFTMLNEIDTHGFLPEDKEQRLWQRFLINLMKYRTAVFATEKVKEAILVFGANGIIQDFSIVPRLLRDALIVETWEGTHNVLCLQILRDSARFDFVGRLKKELKTMTDNWPDDVLTTSKKLYLANLARAQELLIPENLSNMTWVQTHACRVVDLVADLLEIGNLVGQGIRQKNNNTLLQAAHMAHTTFGQSGFDNPVLNGLKDFGLQLVREEPLTFNVREF
jgi:hypothetical protein